MCRRQRVGRGPAFVSRNGAIDPQNGATQHNLGVACLTVGLSAEAAASLERAAQLRSDKSLPFLVEALELEGRGTEAARVCRKLSRAAVNAHDRRRYLARALILEKRLQEAEQELRPLLAVGSPDPSTRLLFAKLLSFRGAFEEAAKHSDLGAQTAPWALQQLAEARPMTEADRPLLDRMRLAAECADLGGTQRCILRFGLGKAFDDLGGYAEAMRHYEAANRFKAASMRLDRAAMVAQYEASSSASPLRSWSAPKARGPTGVCGRRQAGVHRRHASLRHDAGRADPVFASCRRRRRRTALLADRFRARRGRSCSATGALSKAAEDYLCALLQIAPMRPG